MYRFILGINSFWLLFPLYTNLDFNLISIHTIFTSFISALYWFSNYNRLLHNIDRINAIGPGNLKFKEILSKQELVNWWKGN